MLNKIDVPVLIYNVDVIKDAFNGDDYIGIVPDEIIPVACNGYFKMYKPVEFMHMKDDTIFEYIKWEPLEDVELK